MSWTITLEDENGHPISLSNPYPNNEFDLNVSESFKRESRLLKYLDPYGDTVFNHLQMEDLIFDLRILSEHTFIDQKSIARLIALATHCQKEPHTYIRFGGD